MRILIVTDTYPPNVNGAALATERIAIGLAQDGQEMFVLAPSTEFRNFHRKENGITIYRLRSILIQKVQDFRISPQPLHFREIRKVIEKVHPDVIHVNNPGFIAQSAIRIARARSIPVVGTSHFMPENLVHYLHLPEAFEKMVTTMVWKQYASIYGKLDVIISPTQAAADILYRLKMKNKIVVISNGIDLNRFNPRNDGHLLKKRYNLPDVPIVLFLGRLDKEKNLDVLLKAVAKLRKKVQFHVVLVGKGQEMQKLRRLRTQLELEKFVTFTGYLADIHLAAIYKIGDVFVMPSIAELQSLVCMEAMASGLPVIGANAVAIPHLVKNGRNGFLFKPGDAEDLADKLLKVLSDKNLREKMGKESLEIIKEHDIKRVVKATEDVYREVIAMNEKRKPTRVTFRRTIFSNLARVKNYMYELREVFTD